MEVQRRSTLDENTERVEAAQNLQEGLIGSEDRNNSQSSVESEITLNKHNLMGKFPGVWSHTKTLLWKNYLIQKRALKSLIFLILGPFLICSLIIGFQDLANSQTQHEDKDPPLYQMPFIPECAEYSDDPENCFTFGYGVIGERDSSPWIDYTIDLITKVNKLNRTKEFRDLLSVPNGIEYNKKYIQYFNSSNNWGLFDYGLVFCANSFMDIPRRDSVGEMVRVDCRRANFQIDDISYNNGVPIETLKRSYFYTIVYNNSWEYTEVQGDTISSYPMAKDRFLSTIKLLIDSSIINYEEALTNTGKPPPNILIDDSSNIQNKVDQKGSDDDDLLKLIRFNVTSQNYAFPYSRFYNGFNIINQMGAFYYFLMPMYLFVQVQGDIVMEKQRRLRAGLNIQGVSHTAFYLSWFLTSVVFSVAISLLQIVASLIFQFEFFLDTPFFLLFFLFFLFTLSMQIFGYFIATIMPNTNKSYSFSYGFVLFAVVIELFLSKPDAIIPYLYNNERPAWIMIFVLVLNLYSPFQFTLIFVAFSQKAGIHFDPASSNWIRGEGYKWSFLTDTINGTERGITYEAPCPLQSFLLLLVTTALYGVLTWYFDHVVASNRGVNYSWYFLLTPTYWRNVFSLPQKKKQNLSYLLSQNNAQKDEDNQNEDMLIDQTDESQIRSQLGQQDNNKSTVQEEQENVKQRFYQDKKCEGVRIFELVKNFVDKRSIFKKPTIVEAVRGVSIEIYKNEILGLLGHNGAGKTTLLSMLCGLLRQTSGSVTIYNFSTTDEIEKIRQIIGICPQFDILWDDLTGLEHLALFAQIKGMNPKYITQIGHEMLKMVQLDHVSNAYSRTYSGGMKRRLSLAISSQGNPKIILLDEPTTGMDPKSKKEVWNLIQCIRKDKSIILTTHSMEEADVLSDRIAVMVDGKIKCIGTSLKLKSIYGGGYRMHLIIKNSEVNSEGIQKYFAINFPNMKLEKESSNSMIYTIPDKQVVKKLFEMFESYEVPTTSKISNQNEEIFDSSSLKPNSRFMDRSSNLDFSMKSSNVRNSYGIFDFIEDWGISHATIEDVFMQVTEQEESHKQEQENQN